MNTSLFSEFETRRNGIYRWKAWPTDSCPYSSTLFATLSLSPISKFGRLLTRQKGYVTCVHASHIHNYSTNFIRVPFMLNFPSDLLIHVHRPLYGLPESSLHWFVPYSNHHKTWWSITAAVHDLCVLFTTGYLLVSCKNLSVPRGVTVLQTDDTLHLGNRAFIAKEEKSSKKFTSKSRINLVDGYCIKLNKKTISLNKEIVKLQQADLVKVLQKIATNNVNHSSNISQRARSRRWVFRPNIWFRGQLTTYYCRHPCSETLEQIYLHHQKERRIRGIVCSSGRRITSSDRLCQCQFCIRHQLDFSACFYSLFSW